MATLTGQIVYYVLPSGDATGQTRPIIITKVWDETHIDAELFMAPGDWADPNDPLNFLLSNVSFGDAETPGTWFYPPVAIAT
jgi:hypothetical protein